MPEYTSIILLSGGLDSTVLLHDIVKQGENPLPVIFKYGQRHREEIWYAQTQAMKLNLHTELVDLTNIFANSKSALCGTKEAMPDTIDTLGDAQPIVYVPWRNAIFLTVCLNLAESNNIPVIYYAAQLNDNYQFFDTTQAFLETMNMLTSLNRKHLTIIKAPYATKPKKDIIKLGVDLGVDFSKTISCYNPHYNGNSIYIKACGRCPSCTQRQKAFRELGIPDPFRYKS